MGLLDEAIRDHLELKRRRGADPTEIAREQREALEPVFPEEPPLAPEDGLPVAEEDGPPVAEEIHDGADPPEAPPPAPVEHEAIMAEGYEQPAAALDPLSAVGQETAELDMQAVLDQDARLVETARAAADPVRAAGPTEDEPLEWEMPERSTAEPPPEPLPGQERLSFE